MPLEEEDIKRIGVEMIKHLDERRTMPEAEHKEDHMYLRELRKKAEAKLEFRKGVKKQVIAWAVVLALTGVASALIWVGNLVWDTISAVTHNGIGK